MRLTVLLGESCEGVLWEVPWGSSGSKGYKTPYYGQRCLVHVTGSKWVLFAVRVELTPSTLPFVADAVGNFYGKNFLVQRRRCSSDGSLMFFFLLGLKGGLTWGGTEGAIF